MPQTDDVEERIENALMKLAIKKGECPDCGHDRWHKGPSAGLCTNYACANCGSEFNLAPGFDDVWRVERI